VAQKFPFSVAHLIRFFHVNYQIYENNLVKNLYFFRLWSIIASQDFYGAIL